MKINNATTFLSFRVSSDPQSIVASWNSRWSHPDLQDIVNIDSIYILNLGIYFLPGS